MSGPDLTAITATRARLVASDAAVRDLDMQLAKASQEHSALLAAGNTGLSATSAEEQVRDLAQARDRARTDRRDLTAGLAGLSGQIVDVLGGPERAIAALDGTTPMALLPLRIETRYSDQHTLRVRIFPDQVHVSAHDDALTDAEVDAGRRYWLLRWSDLTNMTLASKAWGAMCAGFRPGRARFVVGASRPTNEPAADHAAPIFPEPDLRARGFSAAPTARALPDRIAVVGLRRDAEGEYTEIFRVWATGPVPDALAVGPSSDGITLDPQTGMPSDPAIAWLHDPATAEDLGLLITVTDADLHGARLASGIDRLLAVGVDWTRAPVDAAADLERLLAAQNAEGDLRFVPVGTPTNTTAKASSGSVSAATAAQDHDPATPVPTLDQTAGGRVLARALGLADSALDTVPGAALREQWWQSRLSQALWRVGPGYYLTDMLEGLGVDRGTDEALRDWVSSYVRPAGALPTLCSGRQPYGVLPVVARHRYEASSSRAEQLVLRVGTVLRELAEPLVSQVPALRDAQDATAVDKTLTELLRRTPVPWSLDFRGAVGPVQVKAMSVYWDKIAVWQNDWNALIWSRLHQYTVTRLSELTLDKQSHPLDVPLVLKDGGTAYLGELAALVGTADADAQFRLRENSVALLEALLAASASYEYQYALKRLLDPVLLVEQPSLAARVTIATPDTIRVEPVQSVSPAIAAMRSSVTLGNAVFQQVSATDNLTAVLDKRYRAWVASGTQSDSTDLVYRLGQWRKSVEEIAAAPPEQLEWAFRAHLDVFSSRLDSWWTGLATARLDAHRDQRPSGVHIGAWGWVEDLHPSNSQRDSLGFVHAPSIAHATTAALLRSGRQSHQDDAGAIFDIDLSARRTKSALQVLRGVAQGQRLAALLGYRVERALQDAGPTITRYVWPLRAAFPMRHTEDLPDAPAQSIAARDVVDGVELLDRWRADRAAVLTAGTVSAGDAGRVSTVLDAASGLYDAVSDVLVAEAVHQTAQGNLDRAGAALAAHDRQSAAPTPDVTATPRPGTGVTHRVGLLLQESAPSAGWANDVRSIAEPRLDRWAGDVLGPPSSYAVTARLVRADGSGSDLDPVHLDALGLSALSVVVSCVRPGAGRPSELEALLAAHLAASVQDAGPDDRIELLADGTTSDPTRGLGLLLALAACAGEVLRSPTLSGTDLRASGDAVVTPGGATAPAAMPDVTELTIRAKAVVAALADRLDRPVTGLTASLAARDAVRLASALTELVAFEPTAMPEVSAYLDGAADLLGAQATRIFDLLGARRASATAAFGAIPGDPVAATDSLTTVIRLLLGQPQPVLPLLQLADPTPVAASLSAASALTRGDVLAPITWLHRSALVRPAVDRLADLLIHAEAGGSDVFEHLRLVQAPYSPNAPWIALPYGDFGPPAHGAACFVAHSPHLVDPTQPLAGLVVDSWTETIPDPVETTALTVHVDAPAARPPQAIVLAVHPAVSPGNWDFDTLVDTINEAADLARLRTLTAAELTPLGGFLPAWYLPDVYTRDVPSVQLRGLRDRAAALGLYTSTTILGKR
jgi:hypothetical protein